MNWGKETCREVKSTVQASFADFSHKRSITDDPNFYNRMAGTGGWKAELLRVFAFLSVNNFRVKAKKYVFLSTRHDQLVARFNGDEAAIIGGPKDFRYATESRIPFCFTGDLYLAAYNILFGKAYVPSDWIIKRWLRFFSQQQDPCYLVVANDTMPMSLLLAKIADHCKNMKVVCVQHGLLSAGPGYDYDDVEGRNSAINLVYSEAQRIEMERRIPGALVEVMGYPGDFSLRADAPPSAPVVILVGTGTFEDLANYKASLDIFSRVRDVLEGAGLLVLYRPHPSENKLTLAGDRFRLDRHEKSELLAGARKVFIGFGSTLLYEADLAGHQVIVLNDVALPGYIISDFGRKLDTVDLHKLVGMIESNGELPTAQSRPPDVRIRFERAMARALARSIA